MGPVAESFNVEREAISRKAKRSIILVIAKSSSLGDLDSRINELCSSVLCGSASGIFFREARQFRMINSLILILNLNFIL